VSIFSFTKHGKIRVSYARPGIILNSRFDQDHSREVAMKQRQREQPPFLSEREIKQLWRKTEDNFELYRDIFNYCQEWSSSEMMDPRERNENDKKDRCTFHCHSAESPCRQLDSDEVPAWIG
jgi:hypothetical protein